MKYFPLLLLLSLLFEIYVIYIIILCFCKTLLHKQMLEFSKSYFLTKKYFVGSY